MFLRPEINILHTITSFYRIINQKTAFRKKHVIEVIKEIIKRK